MLAHLLISGYVQGVGYRQFVKKVANQLSLKGWVKNLDDRRVEALFEGNKETIEKAIQHLKKGPFLAKVREINVEWEDKVMSFDTFEVIFS